LKRILVIRLGALGDMALSFTAFAALRAHHAGDRLTLMTTPPYAALMAESPWFDQVIIDTRPSWLDLPGLLRLRSQLRRFDFTYDLQTSRRSAKYFWLAGRPQWSGIAHGCSHPHTNPRRDYLHSIDRQREQLAMAGVTETPAPDLSWLAEQGLVLPPPYALLVPGTSPAHGGAKAWPLDRFAAVAALLKGNGVTPVVVGAKGQPSVADALDLTGRTTIQELAGLAARASLAIGGDTGPIHLAAVMGCPVIALFSRFSDPVQATPVGQVTLLREDDVRAITVDTVLASVSRRLSGFSRQNTTQPYLTTDD
jgi:ADP-heptose:LPS heptosyltransferase